MLTGPQKLRREIFMVVYLNSNKMVRCFNPKNTINYYLVCNLLREYKALSMQKYHNTPMECIELHETIWQPKKCKLNFYQIWAVQILFNEMFMNKNSISYIYPILNLLILIDLNVTQILSSILCLSFYVKFGRSKVELKV